jgi:hypothetical protein
MRNRLVRWFLKTDVMPSLGLSESDLLVDLDPGMLIWAERR